MKNAVLAYAIVECAGSGRAAEGPAPAVAARTAAPQVAIPEADFDFGRVKSTDVLRHEFIVKNAGTAVLELRDVKSACGCTLIEAWDRRIQPGKTGRVSIKFNPTGFKGSTSKSVLLTCNDPAQALHTLRVQAMIWQPVEVHPEYVFFGPTAGDQPENAKVVRIVSNLEDPITLGPPQCANAAFEVEIKAVRAGREFELRVKYVGGAGSPMPRGAITIKTSSPDVPLITIGAGANIQQAFTLMPPQIIAKGEIVGVLRR